MLEHESSLLFARIQMGYSLAFHIIFAVIAIAMPVLMTVSELVWLRTHNPVALQLSKRWAKGAAIFFAIGAVSGTVLSFELGLLWPGFMKETGHVIGIPFSLEGFAFFTEAIFLGIYLYGRDRIPETVHFASGIVVALSGAASAAFVMMVNAWMNFPAGIEPGLAAMFSKTWLVQTIHQLVAAYAATGFAVAGVHAVGLLRAGHSAFHKLALEISLAIAIPMAMVQPFVGDWAARVVAQTQPSKFAAMEGQYPTQTRAPLRIGGIPDEQNRRTLGAIEIPGLLSYLGYGNINAEVKGLDSFPANERPSAVIPHISFQLMVAIGVYLVLLSLWYIVRWVKGNNGSMPHPFSKNLLWGTVLSAPFSFIALEAGWMVTEVGRQPWIVHKTMRVSQAVTPMPGLLVPCIIFFLVYSFLGLIVFMIMKDQFSETLSAARGDNE